MGVIGRAVADVRGSVVVKGVRVGSRKLSRGG